MNIAETISVNPVSKTLGALNPEATLDFINKAATSVSSRQKKTDGKSMVNFVFASSSPSVRQYGCRMLLFRMLFSALLIVSGSFILSGEILPSTDIINSYHLGLGEIIIGSMLALGFLSRFAMGISTFFFGYISVMSLMTGIFDMQALLSCFGSIVFLIMGSGIYSSDFLIRKMIVLNRRRRERKLRAQRLTYRAFRIHNM